MKKISLLLVLCISAIMLQGQNRVDTSQIIVSGPDNATETYQKPYVILISADGFRYDYVTEYHASDLLYLAHYGVWAEEGMYPCFPSKTFPNHYSIITGLYPSHHGIVNNVFYDPKRDDMYIIGSETVLDGSWYGGLPLWGLAEKQGMKAASLFWVGSESDAGGKRPSYYYRYHEEFSGKDKARIIKDWLQLPEAKRPHFITLYFPEVDHAGHEYGPDSPQTGKAVHYVSNAIQYLVSSLSTLDLPINYIFVSDHGMIKVPETKYIKLPSIDRDKFFVVNNGTMVSITAEKDMKDILPLFKKLKALPNKKYKVYLAENVPEELHYSSREDKTRRIGDIILIPDGIHYFTGKYHKNPPVGIHGYNPYAWPEMKSTFIAWGPAFKHGKTVEPFQNTDVYPLVAEILGLKITTSIDGTLSDLKGILK